MHLRRSSTGNTLNRLKNYSADISVHRLCNQTCLSDAMRHRENPKNKRDEMAENRELSKRPKSRYRIMTGCFLWKIRMLLTYETAVTIRRIRWEKQYHQNGMGVKDFFEKTQTWTMKSSGILKHTKKHNFSRRVELRLQV